MMNFFSRRLYLKLIILVVVLVVAGYFLLKVFNKNDNNPASPSGDQHGNEQRAEFSKCSVTVDQPECQKKDSPTLTFKWENCGSPKSIIIEIDDDVNFSHQEFVSEQIEVSGSEQVIHPVGFVSGKTYHPSINLIQEDGYWLGWRDTGSNPFVFAPTCSE